MFNLSLKSIKPITLFNTKASLALITLVSLITLCCGKRTPPVPPTERVSQKATISGYQQGDKVVLSWKMPARNSSANDTTFINRVDIYRLAEPLNSPAQITEEDFSAQSTIIESLPVYNEDFSLKTLSYQDNLKFSTQPARLRYAIKFVNKSGQKAAFSNFLTITPSAKIAGSPQELSYELSQDSITVKWSKPQTNVDGSTPANILGFNIYRKSASGNEPEAKKLNQSIISDTVYQDVFFDFDNKYIYFIRTVSIGSEGEPIESQSSEEIGVLPKDIFPPSAPESVTLAAAPNNISLFFAANPEKDIVGYKIYRSVDKDLPLENWQLLTVEPVKTNTFQDQNVSTGIKYFYYLTAIDKFGNVSQPSEIVSETAF